MEISPLFFGYYSGTYAFELNNVTYEFPLAYFLVMFAIFVVNLVFVVRSFAKAFDTETLELSQAPLSELIFGSWDYSTNEENMADIIKSDISGNT